MPSNRFLHIVHPNSNPIHSLPPSSTNSLDLDCTATQPEALEVTIRAEDQSACTSDDEYTEDPESSDDDDAAAFNSAQSNATEDDEDTDFIEKLVRSLQGTLTLKKKLADAQASAEVAEDRIAELEEENEGLADEANSVWHDMSAEKARVVEELECVKDELNEVKSELRRVKRELEKEKKKGVKQEVELKKDEEKKSDSKKVYSSMRRRSTRPNPPPPAV